MERFERVIKRDCRIAVNLSDVAREHGHRTSAHEATLVDRLLAVAYYYAGDQELASRHAQWALNAAHGAHHLVRTVYERFTEGFQTADLKAARRLLQQLAARLN